MRKTTLPTLMTMSVTALILAVLFLTRQGDSPAWAQPPPVATEEVPGNPNQPPIGNNQPPGFNDQPPPGGEAPPFGQQPTPDPLQPEITPQPEVTAQPEITPEPTPAPPTPAEIALELALNARNDIDLLATAALGTERPEGWTGIADPANSELGVLIRLDLERLAEATAGRPAGWFGIVPSTPYAVARDLRHDIELLADATLGADRPTGWIGGEPILRCDRVTQATISLLELNGVFTLQIDPNAPDFCQQAAQQVSVFMEVNYLSNPVEGGGLTVQTPGGNQAEITEDFAVAFLDRGAGQRVGVVPLETTFEPVARSYAQFSAMMLIRGDGFEVFVDYQTTSVDRDTFDDLPDVTAGTYTPFCDADWCTAG
jgi:hypothetical protein